MAHVELAMQAVSSSSTPVSLHFAATGNEGFSRRRTAFAKPLARADISSMILENPYYGLRRPAGQHSKIAPVCERYLDHGDFHDCRRTVPLTVAF
jgi:hypothetical protein